jgi:hypothetical protein
MLSDYDLAVWVKQNREKIETLRRDAIRTPSKHDADMLAAQADTMEEFTNWMEDILTPVPPF